MRRVTRAKAFRMDGEGEIPETLYELRPVSLGAFVVCAFEKTTVAGKTTYASASVLFCARTRQEAVLKFQIAHPCEKLYMARPAGSSAACRSFFAEFEEVND